MNPNLEPRFTQPDGWQWLERLPTRGGQYIRGGWVIPEGARALAVIFPGLSEYCEKYFETVRDLIARGFAVAILDWRGQGLSWRHDPNIEKRTHDDFANDVADAQLFLNTLDSQIFLNTITDQAPNLPRLLLGHSMGGHIGLRVLHNDPGRFSCAIFSAPMLDLPFPAKGLGESIARLLRVMGRNTGYMPGCGPWSKAMFELNLRTLTTDEARMNMQRHWVEQNPGLRMGGLTAAWLNAAAASMRMVRAPSYLQSIATPCLLTGSGRDVVVSTPAIRRAAARLPTAEYLDVPGALHEVLMEKDEYRTRFWQSFDHFVDKHIKLG